jgi:peroxiredoxin
MVYASLWVTAMSLINSRRNFMRALFLCLSLSAVQIALADEAADELLATAAARAKALHVLTASIQVSWHSPKQSLKRSAGTITLMKPNFALIELSGDYPLVRLASDGRSRYLFPQGSKYSLVPAEPTGKNIDTPWWAFPIRFFFTQSIKPYGPDSPPWTSGRFAGVETVDRETYSVLEISGDKPKAYVARFYFDQHKLLRRSVVRFGEGAAAAVFTAQIEHVSTRRNLRPRDFRFRPSATAKLDTGAESRMLALGASGPDFSLPTPEGDLVRLEELREGKKATLINFWYLACPPCRFEFELFQRLYSKLKDQGFLIIAINNIDDAADIRSYAQNSRLTFPIVLGQRDAPGVVTSYKIETYPSTYLLNSEGKVVYRAVGVDEAGLLRSLKELGLQP